MQRLSTRMMPFSHRSAQGSRAGTVQHWLLLALVASLVVSKPAVAGPVVLTDVLFVNLGLAVLSGALLRWRWPVPLDSAAAALLAYVAALAASLLVSPDLGRSTFKLSTQFYLIGLAILTAALVDSPTMLRRAIMVWLLASGAIGLLAVITLLVFVTNPEHPLVEYGRFYFGTLPPGPYPRLSLTFANGNMLCNYLNVSFGLALLAWQQRWISRGKAVLLLAGIGVAALSTLSPGLGGFLLMGGFVLARSLRLQTPILAGLAMTAGVVGALLFVAAMTVTPILHPTAPYLIHVPILDLTLAPSGRWLTWSAAAAEFERHPWLGHGLGVEPVLVRYLDPSGSMQTLTDAHNMLLNIAAQGGLVGLAGLALLVTLAVQLTRPRLPSSPGWNEVRLALGGSFLIGLLYHGIGGSFEDARHLWVLLGLLIAADRLARAGETRSVSPPDGNNRTAAAPSSC